MVCSVSCCIWTPNGGHLYHAGGPTILQNTGVVEGIKWECGEIKVWEGLCFSRALRLLMQDGRISIVFETENNEIKPVELEDGRSFRNLTYSKCHPGHYGSARSTGGGFRYIVTGRAINWVGGILPVRIPWPMRITLNYTLPLMVMQL